MALTFDEDGLDDFLATLDIINKKSENVNTEANSLTDYSFDGIFGDIITGFKTKFPNEAVPTLSSLMYTIPSTVTASKDLKNI